MTQRSDLIERVATVANRTGLVKLGHVAARVVRPQAVRVLNYHHVDDSEVVEFERQIAWISERYTVLDLQGLRSHLDADCKLSKPAIILTFDDGLRSHVDTVVPTLDRHGIVGWFFIPTDAGSQPTEEHFAWAVEHQLNPALSGFDAGDAIFAGWDDWRVVAERHVCASHTATHRRFSADVEPDLILDELRRSQTTLQAELGSAEPVFCWVGGENQSYSSAAIQALHDEGFEFVFTTSSRRFGPNDDPHRIERTNVESSFSWDRFQLSMSGAIDWRYAKKRRRLDDLYRDGVA